MNISIIGTGYVGLVTGACFSDMGNEVWCVDVDNKKIENLKNNILPIYEPGLENLVKRNQQAKRLHFTIDILNALKNTDICVIAVGTPMGEDGSADLQYVLNVASEVGKHMSHHMFVVDKSTVPVGTAEKVRETIHRELNSRKCSLSFDVISNPEFLKEGTAIDDCIHPSRIIIGTDNQAATDIMCELYLPYVENGANCILMDIASAEMTKYTANAMLATKISFMNEISNICERVGANVNKVRLGVGSDPRIGNHFIYPGCGYGGSCFPKDVRALIKMSNNSGYNPQILESVEAVNNRQKLVIPHKITEVFGENLKDYTFAVWGLAFKPDTNDMRESPAITIISELTRRGAFIQAYDPKAQHEAQTYYLNNNRNIRYFNNKYDVLRNANALILITEWKEFHSPDFDKVKKLLNSPIIFDGRNQYDSRTLEKAGIQYIQIGGKNK